MALKAFICEAKEMLYSFVCLSVADMLSLMVMSLSEWHIKTLFIALSGALEQGSHRV